MATGKAQITRLSRLGLAVETVLGTPVAATGWIPGMRYQPQDVPQFIMDTGMRGTPYQDYGAYLGTKSSSYSLEGMLYPASGGNFLAAILGTDTVTGTTPNFVHTFTAADTPNSYTLSDTYLGQAPLGRQWAGSRCHRLQLKFTPEAGVSYTSQWLGFLSATYVPEAPAWEDDNFLLGWQGAVTFGGVADANLSSFALDVQRVGSKPLFSAANTQNPYDIFVGELKATCDMEFYMTADSEYVYALSEGTETAVVTVTQGAEDLLTLTMSALQFTKPTIVRSGKWVTVKLSGVPLYNATDVGILQAVLTNQISTAYSTTAAS